MALAILELVDFGRAAARFTIDTGTNRIYVLKVGRSFQNKSGIDWIDDITYATTPAINQNGGSLFRSSKEVALPAPCFANGARFVQLFTFKSSDHRSPAFSKVVEIPGRLAPPEPLPIKSYRPAMSMAATFASVRSVPARTATEGLARGASIEDVLASVVKLATPLVQDLLKAGGSDGGKAGASDKSSGGNDALAKVLATLLRSLFGDGSGGTATGKSLSVNGAPEVNRFANSEFSRPFIFGVDDALIGMLAGPVLQALPQLLNAANEHKLQMKQADNRLVSDLVSEVNRRLLLQQLAAAQPQGGATATSPELAKLIALLQQGAAAGTPVAAGAAQSLSVASSSAATLSTRAVLSFLLADPLPWNGGERPLFIRGSDLRLKIELKVGDPVPKSPLPKAIVKVVLKDPADHSVLLEKTFKRKGVAANTPLTVDFTAAELAPLPANKSLEAVAEMRWLTSSSGEHKALGSSELVLVDKYLLKSQGSAVSNEVELTDMRRFRPFWNKLWESPVLDSAGRKSDDARYLWELDVNTKYSVLLASNHASNGPMETKLLKEGPDLESLTERTAGRMKAGIELSLAELNKLLPLWPGQTVLEPAKLEALKTATFAEANATEVITRLKLQGRAGERGMVWAVPVFDLIECTLASIAKTDESGQVTALADETLRFPLPVSIRLLGLKSHQ
jgi:hypothetical protein